MEDMARLAVVEQSVRDDDKFNKILYELFRFITYILENPHDYDLRTIKSDILKEVLKHDAFSEYLKYVGFKPFGSDLSYPKEQTLSNLRMAQVAIQRKISFCYGPVNLKEILVNHKQSKVKRTTLRPANILTTRNPLLLKIEALFNNMIVYEDEELQALAREQIPLVTLQLMALDRVREQQKKIKTGETKEQDLPFDIALLMELLGWFKYKFFTWVDKPACEQCGGPTVFTKSVSFTTERETCRMELYKRASCPDGRAQFPRHNDPRTLLRTRRGRCGEWANCFALMCRALGYDTRYVYDTTDHVWCEVFDYDSNTWLHADPCEAKLNAPLLYCHGWGKKLSYVIAVSRDDLQDVTWRYTMDHKEVLKRRNMCDEQELLRCILALREHRQRQVTEPRRRYLAKRALQELAQLMVEKKPTDYESHGRISGSQQWRLERGELGADKYGHAFQFGKPGNYSVRYYSGVDKYRVWCDAAELEGVGSWAFGVSDCKNIFRKVETDWRKVYLAREDRGMAVVPTPSSMLHKAESSTTDGETTGTISWKLSTPDAKLCFSYMTIRLSSAVYETGNIDWTLQFDEEQPVAVKLEETLSVFERQFRTAVLTTVLSGGVGDVSWQHAQLFRQSLDSKSCAFEISATVVDQ